MVGGIHGPGGPHHVSGPSGKYGDDKQDAIEDLRLITYYMGQLFSALENKDKAGMKTAISFIKQYTQALQGLTQSSAFTPDQQSMLQGIVNSSEDLTGAPIDYLLKNPIDSARAIGEQQGKCEIAMGILEAGPSKNSRR